MKLFKCVIGGMLILATLTGCKSESEKAEERADDGNKMVAQLNATIKDLGQNHKVFIGPGIQTLITRMTIPDCIVENDRPEINRKLSLAMDLAHRVRGIVNKDNISYGGDVGDIDQVYTNAEAARADLDITPDCDSTANADKPEVVEEQTPINEVSQTLDDERMIVAEISNEWTSDLVCLVCDGSTQRQKDMTDTSIKKIKILTQDQLRELEDDMDTLDVAFGKIISLAKKVAAHPDADWKRVSGSENLIEQFRAIQENNTKLREAIISAKK